MNREPHRELDAADPPDDSYVASTFGEDQWQHLHDLTVMGERAARLVQRGRDAFDADEMLQLAAEKICIDAGEAASRVCAELVERHPEIRFAPLRRQRNLAAHRYQDIVPSTIWSTLTVHLPEDIAKVRALMARTVPKRAE